MAFAKILMALLVGSLILGFTEQGDDYKARVEKWRADQQADLTRDLGWLSVAGLYWLSEGDNAFGSDPSNPIHFPAGPPHAGVVTLRNGVVTLQVAPGSGVRLNGQEPSARPIEDDNTAKPDKMTVGDLTFTIIRRGPRVGVRLYDPNCKARKEFTGCKWFAIDPAYCVRAKFTAYPESETMPITNVLGDTSMVPKIGYVTFTLGGHAYRLDAQGDLDGLFLNFSDATSGKSTYGAGRFLDTDKVVNGYVTIDFNEAYNPPCAFTAYATCPLPPKANHLSIPIAAGEMAYHAPE